MVHGYTQFCNIRHLLCFDKIYTFVEIMELFDQKKRYSACTVYVMREPDIFNH